MKKITFILSTQDINSYGFIVLTSGIVLDFFKKNPVMLLNHREDKIMGKWDNVRVDGTQLLADAVFDETDDEAKKMLSKVEQGMLNCTSIGFQIDEVQYGMAGFEDTPIVIKCSLKEASLTPIPSNEGAIRLYDKEGTLLTSNQVTTLLSKNQPIDNMKKLQFFVAALAVVGSKLTNDSTEDDLLKEVTKVTGEHVELTTKLEALTAEKTALEKVVTTLKAKEETESNAKIDGLVDGAVTAGKLTADKSAQYKTLAKADFDTTKSIIDAMPVRTSLSAVLEGQKILGANKYEGWGLKQLHREAPKELQRIKEQEPERYKSLIAENA